MPRVRRAAQLLIPSEMLSAWLREGVAGFIPTDGHLPDDAILVGAHTPRIGIIGLVFTSEHFPDHYPDEDQDGVKLAELPVLSPITMKPAHLYDCPLSLN